MKLKYYLRGLGTGVAVTALIIGISSFASRNETMTDEEVVARAKELGMVERTVLSETVTEAEASESVEESEEEIEPEGHTPTESERAEESEASEELITEERDVRETETEAEPEKSEPEESEPEESEPALENEELEDLASEEESEAAKETVTEESAETDIKFGMPDEAGTVSLSIVRGDSSVSVSRRLEEAGLVDSAIDFDRYLCQKGYDKKIQAGNYEIPVNATQEEIAIMITSH